ncbi:MAG: hypothetical protein JWO97_2426 [Acidobacteria bacterium]|nr:hypothetical protein [Acidobacteriota bacterium]
MRKLLIPIILLLISTSAFAQWRRGALYGADVRALVIDPAQPDVVYLGTSGGEVYVSRDAAKTWVNPRGSVPFPGYIVDNLVVDRNGRLWAACWGLWGGGVIAVSSDGGKTWTRRDAGLEEFSVRAIAVDPSDADFLLVGGLTGVYRTTDGGATWEQISDQVQVESLAIDPRTHDRIFVGTWRQGIRTDDGGKNWTLVNNGMVLDTDMFSITIEPDDPDSVWVSTCGWVYNSPNRGDNWTRFRDGFDNRRIHDIEVDPCNKNSLYAGSVAGLYRTDDRGKSWYRISDESMVINTIALHPQRPDRLILGIEGDGVYVSDDAGKTYTRSSEGLRNLSITSVAADPAEKNRVYAAVVFGGAASGIYESNDAGVNWKKLSAKALPEVLSLNVTDDPEARFVAGTEKGFFFSADGAEWTQAAPINRPIRVDKIVRFSKVRSFAATSEGVFTSRDGGRSWYRLAGAEDRAVDLAVGTLGDKRALFALTSNGILVFDGEKWSAIADAPPKGRTVAIRTIDGSQYVFIAGMNGVKAGRVDIDRVWHAAEAPDAQLAAVFGGTRSDDHVLFLTSRRQREILVGEPKQKDWMSLSLPSSTTEVTAIAPDPFSTERLYVGTLGEGMFVYEGKTQKYVAPPASPAETASAMLSGATR